MNDGEHELDLDQLGLDQGGGVLLRLCLAELPIGARLHVAGHAAELAVHLRAFARGEGHEFVLVDPRQRLAGPRAASGAPFVAALVRGPASSARWRGAERAGTARSNDGTAGTVLAPPAHWGLAARGAAVEAGGPGWQFPLAHRDELWSDDAGALYAEAAAAQWNPATAIPWHAERSHPAFVEDALVQVLTYLIENETAALLVPARFCAQVHPHFREILQLLAIQAADEARHLEVFTRRALVARRELGLSTGGGQASLRTLVDEPDFALASFLLSVLGEGSFLHLLGFLHVHAPDACTAEIMRLAAQDEARHVAFGMSHLRRHAAHDPTLLGRLRLAIERRHEALRHTAGLNAEVFDALVVLAAGERSPAGIARGHQAVAELQQQMHAGRQARLKKLGFGGDDAAQLSALHTRNFM
ncbi:MAG: ferritin-like domain-containing protein [Planctomycetes bacterium]|nr:ferritin-like domain-containing protein [Planctomycetota bacterium]